MSLPGSEEWFREKEKASEIDSLFGIGTGLGAAKAISFLGGFRPGDTGRPRTPGASYGGRVTLDPSHPLNVEDMFHPSMNPGAPASPAGRTFEGRPQTHWLDQVGLGQPLTGPLHNLESVGDDGWKPEYIDLEDLTWGADQPVRWESMSGHDEPEPGYGMSAEDTLEPGEEWRGIEHPVPGAEDWMTGMRTEPWDWRLGGPPDKDHPRINPPFYTPDTSLPGPSNSAPWRIAPSGWFENWLNSRKFTGTRNPADFNWGGLPPPFQGGGDGGGGGDDPWSILPTEITAGHQAGSAVGQGTVLRVDRSQLGDASDAAYSLGAKAVEQGAPNNPLAENFDPLALHGQDSDGALRSRPPANVAGIVNGPSIRQEAYLEDKRLLDEALASNNLDAQKARRGSLEGKFADELWMRLQMGQDFWEVYRDIYNRVPQANGDRVARMVHPDQLREIITQANADGNMTRLRNVLGSDRGGVFNSYLRRSGFYGPLDAGTDPWNWQNQPADRYTVNPDGSVTFKNPGAPGSVWPGGGSLGYVDHKGGTPLSESSDPAGLTDPTKAGIPYWSHGGLNPGQGGLAGTANALSKFATVPQNVLDIGKTGLSPGSAEAGAFERFFREQFPTLATETDITRGRMYSAGTIDTDMIKQLIKHGKAGAKSLYAAANPPAPPDPWQRLPNEPLVDYYNRTKAPSELNITTDEGWAAESANFKKMYREMATRTHPDKPTGDHEAFTKLSEAKARFESYKNAPADQRITAEEALRNPSGDKFGGAVASAGVSANASANAALKAEALATQGNTSSAPGRNRLGDAFGPGQPAHSTDNKSTRAVQKAHSLSNPKPLEFSLPGKRLTSGNMTPGKSVKVPGVAGATGFVLTAAVFDAAMSGDHEMRKGLPQNQAMGATTTGQIHRDIYHHARGAADGNTDNGLELARILQQAGLPKDEVIAATNGIIQAAANGQDPIQWFNKHHNHDAKAAGRNAWLKTLHHMPLVGNFTGSKGPPPKREDFDTDAAFEEALDEHHSGGQNQHGFGNLFNDPNKYIRESEQGGFQSGVTMLAKLPADLLALTMGMDPEAPMAGYTPGQGFGFGVGFKGGGASRHIDAKQQAKKNTFMNFATQAYESGDAGAISQANALLSAFRGIQFQGDDFVDEEGNAMGWPQGEFLNYLMNIGSKVGAADRGYMSQAYGNWLRDQDAGWQLKTEGSDGNFATSSERAMEDFRRYPRNHGVRIGADLSRRNVRAPGVSFLESVGDLNHYVNPFAGDRDQSIFPSTAGKFKRNFEQHVPRLTYSDPSRSFRGFLTHSPVVKGEEGWQLAQDEARRMAFAKQGHITVPNLQYDLDGDNRVSQEELEWAAQQKYPFGQAQQIFNVGGLGSTVHHGESSSGVVGQGIRDLDENARPQHSLFQLEHYLARNAELRNSRRADYKGKGWTPKMEELWRESVGRRGAGHDYVYNPSSKKWEWTADRLRERMQPITDDLLSRFAHENVAPGYVLRNGQLIKLPREKSLWEKNFDLRKRIEYPSPEQAEHMPWWLRILGRGTPGGPNKFHP